MVRFYAAIAIIILLMTPSVSSSNQQPYTDQTKCNQDLDLLKEVNKIENKIDNVSSIVANITKNIDKIINQIRYLNNTSIQIYRTCNKTTTNVTNIYDKIKKIDVNISELSKNISKINKTIFEEINKIYNKLEQGNKPNMNPTELSYIILFNLPSIIIAVIAILFAVFSSRRRGSASEVCI